MNNADLVKQWEYHGLVRCKDCKYSKHPKSAPCGFHICAKSVVMDVRDDFFCAEGKRVERGSDNG